MTFSLYTAQLIPALVLMEPSAFCPRVQAIAAQYLTLAVRLIGEPNAISE